MEKFWGNYKGGVSITFDDGRACQLKLAVPLMDERNIRGTFYLCPGGSTWEDTLAPWVHVRAAGHEIGNHTLSHPCSNNILSGSGGYEDMSLEDLERDILLAQERLESFFPEQKAWSFAYPCYCTYVGKGEGRKSYVPVIAKHFTAGRAGGEYGFGAVPGFADPAAIPGLATDRMSGFEMIGLVEELTARGQWVVLVFHEISGDRLTVGRHDFIQLLDYLNRKKDEILTAPFAEIAGRLKIGDRKSEAGNKETD